MKTLFFTFLLGLIVSTTNAISPFYNLGSKNQSIDNVVSETKNLLQEAGYEILGTYNVGNNSNQQVLVFTSEEIKTMALSYKDRGALAIAQKVGFTYKDNKTTVSLLNSMYMFNAYFQKDIQKNLDGLKKMDNKLTMLFRNNGYQLTAFGGDLSEKNLHDYQYMFGMPEFTDPVDLYQYSSFEQGLKVIHDNLKRGNSDTKMVYQIIFPEKEIAVFGIGLINKDKGEDHFLQIIGNNHLAAMPYEIILQGKNVTMLHGRYRFALYWPELTMTTFTKIMSSPGDVEEFLKSIVQ